MPTEEEVKQWVREEHNALKAEEQATCAHAVSGSYQPPDFDILLCDQCGKIVTMADADPREGRGHLANTRV